MSRRQSVDRPGILSPPGPFLTPSPSPSIPASPRLQPSPSQSPFSHDVLIVTNNTITNTTQEQERKAATPSRRPSIHQINSGSPNAGTVVFQPSPSQSPAAAQTVVGITGNEFNTTLVGSNNISLNKKTGKRTPQSYVNYSHGTPVAATGSLTTTNMANSPKGSSKKATAMLQSQMTNHPSSSPVTSESPIASPSNQIKPPTPQPMLQSLPVMNAGNHLLQFIQGPQIIAAPASVANQQRSQHISSSIVSQSQSSSSGQTTSSSSSKNSRGHQQILPKPQQTSTAQTIDKSSLSQAKAITIQQQHGQISHSPQPQTVVTSSGNQQQQGGQQIILPTGNLNTQPLLLNQMPVIVQQNTPQGVQLILRPPTPQLAAPSLVIHNSRPQLQQQQPQQLLRILNTNGTMQLAAAPTFIVSSQANLIQQNLQTIKANTQSSPITQLSGLHTNPRSNIAAAFNSHIIGQSVAQLQNLQLNGNLAQIQMPNGLNGPIISQLPTQFQHLPAGFNQLNLNQLNSTNLQQQIAAAAAAASAAAFQSPPPPQVSEIQMPSVVSAGNIQFSTGSTSMGHSVNLTSPAVTPQPQLLQSVTPEPVRNPTPTLQNVISHQGATTTVLVQPDGTLQTQNPNMGTAHLTKASTMKNNASDGSIGTDPITAATGATTKPPKKPKARKKKAQPTAPATTQASITTSSTACTIAPMITPTNNSRANKKDQKQSAAQVHISQQLPQLNSQQSMVTSTGKLDLANVMKLCGIMEDDDFMDPEPESMATHQQQQPHDEQSKQSGSLPQPQMNIEQQQQNISANPNTGPNNSDIMITIPGQNSDIPLTFTIPTSHCESMNQVKPMVTVSGSTAETSNILNNSADLKSNTCFDSQNIVIKIDQLDNVPPYTITIPRDEIQQSIQLAQQQQQQLQNQQATNHIIQTQHVQPQQIPRSVSVTVNSTSSLTSIASSSSSNSMGISSGPTFVSSHITLQSQLNEIQNQLMGVASASAGSTPSLQMPAQPIVQVTPTSMAQQLPSMSQVISNTTTTPVTTTTTAAVKPRRKPAAKRNGKKVDTITTPVGNVPSQIGNIQISQIDATKINANQTMPISNVVENKIQIMPIIDSSKGTPNQSNQQQGMQQLIHQTNIQQVSNDANKVTVDNRNPNISAQSSAVGGNITMPIVSQQNSQAAAVFPQLTGNLSLTFEEDGGRFILRHDPNLPQDPQSQIILQAILSGALCNVTVVNEPFDKAKALKNNVTLNSTNISASGPMANHQHLQPLQQQQQQPLQNIASKPAPLQLLQNIKNPTINQQIAQQPAVTFAQQVVSNQALQQSPAPVDSHKRLPDAKKDTPMAMVNATQSMVVSPTSPKLVALPKVDANQQLFTLNTVTNQITHISPNQTTAALGPMERLLIVPVGINAQQLAECLSQGQIHFNNIGQATQATESQIQSQPQPQLQQQSGLVVTSQPPVQIQQQIVRPQQHQAIQPLQQNPPAKQVANVAPIIDASKAKAETKPKKAPKPRKPKACNDNIAKAVKPIKKLDLSNKPSANPVQIVQPNTATKDLPQSQQQQGTPHIVRPSPGSNISTSISSNIHPFQTTPSGNKLVGVTAPMQQVSQQQRNSLNNNQCNTSNSNSNLNTSSTNNMAVSGMASNQPSAMPVTSMSSQISMAGISSAQMHLPTVTVTSKSHQDVVQQMPPLVSVSATTPVPRVQTIQLTPQQQHLLKTVQTQIQTLSARLQNKSLLANLNIPSDFNPNNPIYNKPLPQLNNLHNMSDAEIHAALQRLFIEQQKILASGKLIPTIPAPSPHAFITSPSPVPSTQSVQSPSPSPTQAQAANTSQSSLPFQNKAIPSPSANLHTSSLIQNTHMKNEGQSIPANVVQPNNHNTTQTSNQNAGGNQQRIHIYPLQHQVQLQQQSQQTYIHQQQQLQTVVSNNQNNQPDLNTHHAQMQIQQFQTQQQHQIQTQSGSPPGLVNPPRPLQQSTPIKQQQPSQFMDHQIQLPSPQQQQQTMLVQQMQQHQQNQPSQQHTIIPANQPRITNQFAQAVSSQSSLPTTIPQPLMVENIQNPPSVALQTDVTNQEIPILPPSLPQPQSATTPVTVTIKTESGAEIKAEEAISPAATSPKPKIPRHCLFERQLKVDQDGCINPDYMTPFQSKEDAVKRLIRYHCMYQQDESIPSDEDDELEKIALGFQEKFKVIAEKYQYLLLQESMRVYRTSELCLVNELLVTDAQNELKEWREESSNSGTLNGNVYHQNSGLAFNTGGNNSINQSGGKTIKKEPENGVQTPKLNTDEYLMQQRLQPDYQFNTNYQLSSNQLQQEQYHRQQVNPQTSSLDNKSVGMASSNNNIKSEIKSEPLFDKCDNQNISNENKLMNNQATSSEISLATTFSNTGYNKSFNSTLKNEKDRNMYSNNSLDISTTTTVFSSSLTTTTTSSTKNSNFVKREVDSFDIESEITPSFIMKKVESNSAAASLPSNKDTEHDNMANSGFSIDYFMHSDTTTTYGGAASTSLHLNEQLSVKGKEDNDAAKAEQYDEWLCIQKELSFMTEKKNDASIGNHHEQKLSEIFDSSSNKTVDNHLSCLFHSNSSVESTMEPDSRPSNKDHHNISVSSNLHLSEFFNPDSIASKSVENRLDAMFGGSPVGEKADQDSVESRLEEIFNGSASPNAVSQHYGIMNTSNQNKRQWNNSGDLMTPNTSGSSVNNTYSKRSLMGNNYLDDTHVASNQRWMMDQNQFDFMAESTGGAQDVASGRCKRSWNGEIASSVEHMSSTKKMCYNSKADSELDHDLLGLGTSESNDAITNELIRHGMNQHTALQDSNSHMHQNMTHMNNNVMMQLGSSTAMHDLQPTPQQQQQQLHDFQRHLSHPHHVHHQMQINASSLMNQTSIFDSTLSSCSVNPNLSGSSSSTSISSNFDEDINRHVQNAIDSILNLHSSENDSLNFSLEHSMGSFLTDNPLDQPHNPSVGGIIHTSSALSSAGKRRHRMDDLGDCMISGAGMSNSAENASLIVGSPPMSSTSNNGGNGITSATIADFSCVTSIDEAVKSIMTS